MMMTKAEYIESKSQLAREKFLEGYSCSQCLVLAFSDLFDYDVVEALKAVGGFGGGTGRLRLTCGAFSGIVFLCGHVYPYGCERPATAKQQCYALIQDLAADFARVNGSLICGELLSGSEVKPGLQAEERTPEYYKKRPCPEIIASAAGIFASKAIELGLVRAE